MANISNEHRKLIVELLTLGRQVEPDFRYAVVLANHLVDTRSGNLLTLELKEQIKNYKNQLAKAVA